MSKIMDLDRRRSLWSTLLSTLVFLCILAGMLFAAGLVHGTEPSGPVAMGYWDGFAKATREHKPLLVLVSTEWCPACQVMKRRIMPQVKGLPLFGRVVYATVNPDNEGDLSRSLIGNGPIPQLILFRRQAGKWSRTALVGAQTVETVTGLIERGTIPEVLPPVKEK